jgi:hypothetical protein
MKLLITLVFPLILLVSAIAFAKDKPHRTPTRTVVYSHSARIARLARWS